MFSSAAHACHYFSPLGFFNGLLFFGRGGRPGPCFPARLNFPAADSTWMFSYSFKLFHPFSYWAILYVCPILFSIFGLTYLEALYWEYKASYFDYNYWYWYFMLSTSILLFINYCSIDCCSNWLLNPMKRNSTAIDYFIFYLY